MLTKDQKRYLEKIPASKRVKIYLFDKKVQKIAENIIQSVKEIYPDLKVVYMGASALGIAGQKDLDIYAFSEPKDFNKYLPRLTKLFCKPKSKHETFIEWNTDIVFDGDGVCEHRRRHVRFINAAVP